MARLRMIAGPNGSGKTTLTKYLFAQDINFGIYLNADEIESELRYANLSFSFNQYGLKIEDAQFRTFYKTHPLRIKAEADFIVEGGQLILLYPLPEKTYFPALFADFLRQVLLEKRATFSFETVMSDIQKVDLLTSAKLIGYRNYLYFVCTDNAAINIARVADRVQQNGHDVATEKLISRYKRSLENLLPAIRQTHRTFLFDNSGMEHKLIAQFTNGYEMTLDTSNVPHWLSQYVLARF